MEDPQYETTLKSLILLKIHLKKRKFSGALRAYIISFLNFRQRRGCPFFLGGNLVLEAPQQGLGPRLEPALLKNENRLHH